MYEVHEVFADGDEETRGGYDSQVEARESIREDSPRWVIWHPGRGTVERKPTQENWQ